MIMKKKVLSDLEMAEKLVKTKHAELGKLIDFVDKAKTEAAMPALKSKYENTYWIYDNGYSATNRWPIYSFCKKVVGINRVVCDNFQSMTDGRYEFRFNEESYDSVLQKKITKAEYNHAKRLFLKRANSL
jgi:hypothetical protein